MGFSALSKNLANLYVEPYSCEILVKEYEECMSRTPTSCDAQCCEKIRKRMASCLESVQRRVEREKKYGESLLKEANAAGFARVKDHWRYTTCNDPAQRKIICEMYNECLSRKGTNCESIGDYCPQCKIGS
ncbi:unnamed protein product [Camellia sinensis]